MSRGIERVEARQLCPEGAFAAYGRTRVGFRLNV
jgi:hypothetical protein